VAGTRSITSSATPLEHHNFLEECGRATASKSCPVEPWKSL
jgi:hypothetical protein